jgi:ParB family chromosome partitioning protein
LKVPRARPRKSPTKRQRTPRKAAAGTRGIEPQACRLASPAPELAGLCGRIEREGGSVLAAYREPLGGQPLVLAALPIERVAPTPFQRDLSEAHHKKLAGVLDRTGLFLDPLIAITAPGEGFWTPNGRHRLAAMQRLGARAITALVVPQREVAWQILALNTEKAHNLRERALEAIRIYRGLIAEEGARPESEFAHYLEEAALVTLGIGYERKATFAGGAYAPILRRLETFSQEPLARALAVHERRAELLLQLDALVGEAVARLKARGLVSPYLRSFVVARINPLRWIVSDPPPLEDVLETMRRRAEKFDAGRVRQEDLARAGGAPDEES